jgi:hypothetical protein
MAAKQLMPNQHMPLHFLYGFHDCCLCKSQQNEEFYKQIYKDDVKFLLQYIDEDFVGREELEFFKSRMELIKDRLK